MWNRIKIALYTLLSTVNVSLIGQMRLSEVLVLLATPFMFDKEDFSVYPYLKKIILALLLLLGFQIFTDLFIVHNTPANYFRGWASIIICILSFIVLFKVLRGYNDIMFYFFLIMLKNIFYTDDIVDSDMTYFKFKIVPILSSAVYLLAAYFYKRNNLNAVMAVLFGYSLTCLAFDSRSTGVVFFLSAIIIYFFNRKVEITRAKVILFSLVALVIFQIAYIFYVDGVLNGQIGGDHARTQMQRVANPYNPLQLLMTGRGETFAAVTAINDQPYFGHGSWATDKTLKYYQILLMFHDEEFNPNKVAESDYLIPSHSILLGAWINCGIGGFIAVLLILIYLLKMGFFLIRNAQNAAIYPVIVILTIGLIWTFAFSPFQQLRFSIPATGAILLSSYYDFVYDEEEDYEEMELSQLPDPLKHGY
jgi:hypothetical protein